MNLKSGAWATSADEKATLFANHLSEVFKPNPSQNEFFTTVIQETLDNADPVKVDLENTNCKNNKKKIIVSILMYIFNVL